MSNMLTSNSGRNPDGTWAKGHSPANIGPQYRYAQRAKILQEELTAGQLLALNKNNKELMKRPAIDAIVVRRLARALKRITPETCADVERAAEAHLDRVEGKPKGTEESVDGKSPIVVQIVQFNGVQYETRKYAQPIQAQQIADGEKGQVVKIED